MRMKTVMTIVVLLLAFSAYSSAEDMDAVLNKAKAEGKIVMLELGSVGCIPCEQMKPVMQKLRDTYQGKLDVIFVDVKKDHETAHRFNVHIIPVQVFLDKTGKEIHRHMGFYSYEEIVPVLRKAGL